MKILRNIVGLSPAIKLQKEIILKRANSSRSANVCLPNVLLRFRFVMYLVHVDQALLFSVSKFEAVTLPISNES